MATLKDVAAMVAAKMEVTKKDAEAAVRATFEVIAETMKTEEVNIPNFGKFVAVEKEAREARNPQTGETIQVEAHKAPKFKASSVLKEAVR